jgi:hypothetical protein
MSGAVARLVEAGIKARSESHSLRIQTHILSQIVDHLARQLSAMQWKYADHDSAAKQELAARIAREGKRLGMITYSDLVSGVVFRVPHVNGGRPYEIDVRDWTGFDRAFIGDFLGAISATSYIEADFLATALVVNKLEFKPSDHFFEWMVSLGVLAPGDDEALLAFWIDHVNRAHNWYARH